MYKYLALPLSVSINSGGNVSFGAKTKSVTLLSLVMRISSMYMRTLNQELINRSEIYMLYNSSINMGDPDQLNIVYN